MMVTVIRAMAMMVMILVRPFPVSSSRKVTHSDPGRAFRATLMMVPVIRAMVTMTMILVRPFPVSSTRKVLRPAVRAVIMLVTSLGKTALLHGKPHWSDWTLQRRWILLLIDAYKGRLPARRPALGSRRLLDFEDHGTLCNAASCTAARVCVWEVLCVRIVLNVPR